MQNSINFGFCDRLFLCWSQNDILHLAPVAECLDLVCCAFDTHLCFCRKQKMPKTKKMDDILCLVTVWWLLQRNLLSVQLHPHLQWAEFSLSPHLQWVLVLVYSYLCSFTLTCSVLTEPSPLQWDPYSVHEHCVHSVCIVQGLGMRYAYCCCQRMQMQCIPGLIPFYIIQSFPTEINFSPRSAMFVGFSPEQCSTLLTPQA